ncbi:hypothetical protein BS47DRAFT_806799 [Hydnum rufescens UP504]|uniref:Uncharacterized protein n=1 Tax=Hydnum rufescens UP504 TaxID=1448309 RepID=A0A9P6AE03_9AGAM|nr:hypothetical protein BS47DRAFT_806799 [Hydnum rufescens UP504]
MVQNSVLFSAVPHRLAAACEALLHLEPDPTLPSCPCLKCATTPSAETGDAPLSIVFSNMNAPVSFLPGADERVPHIRGRHFFHPGRAPIRSFIYWVLVHGHTHHPSIEIWSGP